MFFFLVVKLARDKKMWYINKKEKFMLPKKLKNLIKNSSNKLQNEIYVYLKDTINGNRIETINEKLTGIKENIYEQAGKKCPFCGSIKIINYGKYKETQRYKCKNCKKYFNDYTHTALSGIKDKSTFYDYIKCFLEGLSIRKIAVNLKISISTSFNWRHKILSALNETNCNHLEGIVEIDETFFPESHKGEKNYKPESNKKKPKIAVITSCDRKNHHICGVSGAGRITKQKVKKIVGKYIDKTNTICSDAHATYSGYTTENKIPHEILNSQKNERVKRKIYHIQNINNYHKRLKEWMIKFHGVATKYLRNYVSGFKIIDEVKNLTHKTEKILRFCLSVNLKLTNKEIWKGDPLFIKNN
jgi:transposase-like protein